MERESDILGYLSEALDFDHWDNDFDQWDNGLHGYMIADPEPSHEQHDGLHRFSSSSGTKNEASSSHSNEQQRRNEVIDLDSDSAQPNQHVHHSNSPAISNSIPPVASTSTVPVERDETRPRSVPESPLFIPSPPELRSSTSGDLNLASSVPRTGSVQPPSHQNLPHQQQRPRSELAACRSLVSSSLAGSGDHHGLVLQPGGDNSQMPHSFRALAAASRGRRSRLTVSQMQSFLDVMRRDPNLDPSLLFDGAAGGIIMRDRYRDMRLDVDNMSYEELLALEERIGDVCTGVSEETISNRLKQRKFKSGTQDAEPCCICQEEYSEGEEMGRLECGHDFHRECIKEWLKQKNLCPICKSTGLNTGKKRKIG